MLVNTKINNEILSNNCHSFYFDVIWLWLVFLSWQLFEIFQQNETLLSMHIISQHQTQKQNDDVFFFEKNSWLSFTNMHRHVSHIFVIFWTNHILNRTDENIENDNYEFDYKTNACHNNCMKHSNIQNCFDFINILFIHILLIKSCLLQLFFYNRLVKLTFIKNRFIFIFFIY